MVNRTKNNICYICSSGQLVEFCSRKGLDSHLLIKHGITKPYRCEICKLYFKTNSSLTRHTKNHTPVFDFNCNICKAKFKRNDVLNQHIREVHSPNDIKCDHCELVFSSTERKNVHIRVVHSGIQKQYTCNKCDYRTHSKYKLRRHFDGVHLNIRRYYCSVCNMPFSHKQKLILHTKNTKCVDLKENLDLLIAI